MAGTLRDGGDELRDPAQPGLRRGARRWPQAAVADGVDVLAVMGGDGMMHLGVNTSRRPPGRDRRTTLGLIPAGTGNDLCRGLGLDPDDPVGRGAR